jgi:hypothetical protein
VSPAQVATAWLLQALNLVTGPLDEVGGMMLTTPAVDAVAILSRLGFRGTYDRWRSRARQMPEFAGELPVATLAAVRSPLGPMRSSGEALTWRRSASSLVPRLPPQTHPASE